MNKHHQKDSKKGEVNTKNTQIVTGEFSSSLRVKTIIFFLVALIIPFIVVMCVIYFVIPQLYVIYEDRLAKNQVSTLLSTVQDGIASIRVSTAHKYIFC